MGAWGVNTRYKVQTQRNIYKDQLFLTQSPRDALQHGERAGAL